MTELKSGIQYPIVETDGFKIEKICEAIDNPSTIIKHFSEIVDVDDLKIHLQLVTMKSTFILFLTRPGIQGDLSVFNELDEGKITDNIFRDKMIKGFLEANGSIRGLSLAVGQLGTNLYQSDCFIDPSVLAARLSKNLNGNKPVYVSQNFPMPDHSSIERPGFESRLYGKIFDFVERNYKGTKDSTPDSEKTKSSDE